MSARKLVCGCGLDYLTVPVDHECAELVPPRWRYYRRPASVVRIALLVADEYGVNPVDLWTHTRELRATEARLVAMRLVRVLTDLSYPEIARAFDRDHSTIISACRTAPPADLLAALRTPELVAS